MQSRCQLPGESSNNCRRRVWAECLETWKGQDDVRRQFQLLAAQENTASRHAVVLEPEGVSAIVSSARCKRARSDEKVEYAARLVVQPGFGTLGLGDSSWSVALGDVAEADRQEQGFVKKFAASWRARCCKEINLAHSGGRAARQSCLQSLGFCRLEVEDPAAYNSILADLRNFMQVHRQSHLVQGKNKGPSATIQRPLLVLCDQRPGGHDHENENEIIMFLKFSRYVSNTRAPIFSLRCACPEAQWSADACLDAVRMVFFTLHIRLVGVQCGAVY